MRIIKTNCGSEVFVDDIHYPYLRQFDWKLNTHGYAFRKDGGYNVLMHREILGLTKGDGIQYDHIDRNKLNNQLSNLRLATQSQNMANRTKYNGNHTSMYKGVHYCKRANKWIAKIKVNGKIKYIGSFLYEENGARAYNKVASEIFGEFEVLNDVPEVPTNLEPIKYRGVYLHSRDNKWVANAKLGSERFHLGYFDSEKEALEARNKWALEYSQPIQFWIGDSINESQVHSKKVAEPRKKNCKRIRRKNSNS